jgi:hypothetical protein
VPLTAPPPRRLFDRPGADRSKSGAIELEKVEGVALVLVGEPDEGDQPAVRRTLDSVGVAVGASGSPNIWAQLQVVSFLWIGTEVTGLCSGSLPPDLAGGGGGAGRIKASVVALPPPPNTGDYIRLYTVLWFRFFALRYFVTLQ